MQDTRARKTHTKSRQGCYQCKRRHVKCNETRPQCAPCVRMKIQCSYPPKTDVSTPSTWAPHGAPSPGHNSPSIPSFHTPSAAPSHPQLAVDDLRLLHHWVLNTCPTISTPASQHLWQTAAVELGFRHHFLLHGVLALAAIHRASVVDEASERESLSLQSSAHIDAAISAFRVLSTRPDPATCVPVFILACVLVMHPLAFAQVQPPKDPIADLGGWLRLIRGVRVTVEEKWERIRVSVAQPLIQGARRKDLGSKDDVIEVIRLKELVRSATHLSAETTGAFLAAVDELHGTFQSVLYAPKGEEMSPLSIALSWPVSISEIYLDQLADHNHVALVIMAYYAVLLHIHENVWWVRGWGGWTLAAVRSQVDEEYHSWLQWPSLKTHGR